MRTITTHQTNGCNKEITITADPRDATYGNTSYEYCLRWQNSANGIFNEKDCHLGFQYGPIKENGVNGISNEVLLAVVADRIEGFQSGAFACDENAEAHASVMHAINVLNLRTSKRVARGVEGKNVI